jgi:hypothetical protein
MGTDNSLRPQAETRLGALERGTNRWPPERRLRQLPNMGAEHQVVSSAEGAPLDACIFGCAQVEKFPASWSASYARARHAYTEPTSEAAA